MTSRQAALALALAAALPGSLALTGCGPGEPQGRKVTITGNSLVYAAKPASFSGTDRFAWSLNAQSAFVRLDGTALTAGSVHASILDSAGQVVFDEEVTPKVTATNGPTRSGIAGEWQVRLVYSEATGAVQIDAKGSQ